MTDEPTEHRPGPPSAMRFVGTTVARTLIVVATLGVLIAGYLVLYRLPRQRARDEWTACAGPHIRAADHARYDPATMERELNAAKACGEPPP
jgi:hypothetical protein